MFPTRLLETEKVDETHVAPVWLTADDDEWLRELAGEMRACHGLCSDVANDRIRDRVAPLARRHGVGPRVVEAAWVVERRKWTTRIDSPVPPVDLRRVVFDLAAERARDEALATASAQLGIPVDQIPRALFADRRRARLLVAPAAAASEADLRDAYNLAVVQTLLGRSVEVVATVRAHLRAVALHAKRLGLMATFEDAADGATRMSISGPLSVFHHTLKYSRAFATWFPTLVATPGWSLDARVFVAGETSILSIDGNAPLPRPRVVPALRRRRLDGEVANALLAMGSEWRMAEAGVVRVGRQLLFPDFALACDRGRVVVEVAGLWSAEYLAARLELLRAAPTPFVICVNAKVAPAEAARDPRALVFDGALEAAALLEACEQALRATTKEQVLRGEEPRADACPPSTSGSSTESSST